MECSRWRSLPEVIDRQDLVRSLTIAQLEALGDALLDFNGMADLEGWFKANLSPS